MTKTVVIHQPDLLPYLGFFHRFLHADLYVALDHVQFVHSSRGWTHRDKIKTPQGPRWMTVSVERAPRGTPINAIELFGTDWRTENLNLIRANYRGARHFDLVFQELQRLYERPCTRLVEFTLASIEVLQRLFDVEIPVVMSSSLHPTARKSELLVEILEKVGATHYLSGLGARAYLDPAPFSEAGIEVNWQEFTHPVYSQLHGEFVPFLSSIDLLFNCGIDESRDILRKA